MTTIALSVSMASAATAQQFGIHNLNGARRQQNRPQSQHRRHGQNNPSLGINIRPIGGLSLGTSLGPFVGEPRPMTTNRSDWTVYPAIEQTRPRVIGGKCPSKSPRDWSFQIRAEKTHDLNS